MKSCFLTGSVAVAGNLTNFNNTRPGTNLDFDLFGGLFHDIMVILVIIVLLVVLCCFKSLCPTASGGSCQQMGLTLLMFLNLITVVILWVTSVGSPQWPDMYLIQAVLIAVVAVEGQGTEDKNTKVLMLVSATTFTIGVFPESWLIWLQIPMVAAPMLIGGTQTDAVAAIVVISFGMQAVTMYTFSYTCSSIAYILVTIISAVAASVS